MLVAHFHRFANNPEHAVQSLFKYLLPLLLLTLLCELTFGQKAKKSPRKFKIGDEIEYLWVNKWLPGTVLGAEGNFVAIEYEWGGSMRQETVDANKVRFAWEAKAITPMRTWNDEKKQFSIRAAALGFKQDSVRLYKEDGTEITVPIAKLSESDRKFLDRVRAQAGPPIAELPELDDFAKNPNSISTAWNEAENLSAVAPDAPPAFAQVPMSGVGFAKAHFFETLTHVHPIGGGDGWIVAGTIDGQSQLPSRVIWASLKTSTVKRMQLLPAGERLSAVDPRSRQVLTVNKEGPRLTLWSADPNTEQPIAKRSWISVSDDKWGSWNNWTAIVAPNRVLHEWGKQQFVVWDTEANREVYRIDQESFFSARPTLSPANRYIALPEDKRVRIIEAANGKTLASLPVEGGSAAGVGFNAQGTQLAVLTRSQLAIWTLGSADGPERFRADSVGTPFSADVEWVDDHSLLIDRETLYDTQLELPVWNYKAKVFEVQSDSWGEKTQSVLGDKLCYAVTVGSSNEKAFVVGAVELPGPRVREAVASLDPESLYIIKPGHAVRTEVQCGEYNQEVQAALEQQIRENGWVLDNSASTVMKAEMGRSETQTVKYKSTSGAGEMSVTITPYFSRLQITVNNEVAWQTGSGSGAPHVMFLQSGESAQAKANEMQKPYPGLFAQANIPEKIFDPKKKNGIGSSLISSQGLTPQ